MSSHLSRRWRRPHVGRKGNHRWQPCKWLSWLRRHDDRAEADLLEATTTEAMELCEELVTRVHTFLGSEGLKAFGDWFEEYGTVSPMLSFSNGFPHAVHFHEGMQVRNFMRNTGLCDSWTDHDLDNLWAEVVCIALRINVEDHDENS